MKYYINAVKLLAVIRIVCFVLVRNMGKAKQLTKSEKSQILDHVKHGMPQMDIAIIFKVSQSVVSKTVKRDAENVSLSPKKSSGHPRKTSDRTDRRIVNLVNQIPNITSIGSNQGIVSWCSR